MLFDTHFHLDLFENPSKIVTQIELQKIYTIAVTNLPKLFPNTHNLCEGYKYIRPALGFHPELAFQYHEQIDLFESLIDNTRYIGEVGLDNRQKSREDFYMQKHIFERILKICAEKGNKILTIHSRRAEKEVIDLVGQGFPGKVILHWYSGSLRNLEKGLSNGYYFSVNLAMTQSKNGTKIVDVLPLDKILLETDGPFTELQGQKSTPMMTELILTEIAKIKRVSVSDISDAFKSNFYTLLK